MFRKLLISAGLALVVFGTAIAATFDGAPAAPLNFNQIPDSANFDVQVHERGSLTSLPLINAQHGPDCSAPPATHPNTSFEGSVYQCANHIMTAMNGPEYGLIVLTPNQMLDFSAGGTVSFDVSTERMSVRDWWDITVSPFADAQALPLLSDLSQGVDLQNPNRNSVVIATDNGEAAPNLKVVQNGVKTSYGPPGYAGQPINSGILAGTNQAATRQPFRLTLTTTHVRFERLATATGAAKVFIDKDIPALNFTQGVVQIGHHSYTPTKDGAGVPATWHWDNISVSPVIPFSIQRGNERMTQGGTVTFPSAPSGAYLRFSALCKPVVNGVVGTKMTDSGHPEHAASYMIPIPAGSTSVSLSLIADGWYSGPCHAKDFHVWSLNTGPVATATNTPLPTDTPTPGPTSTPTNTPVPPTATNTVPPTPATYACVRMGAPSTIEWVRVGGGSCP